jgi:beta-glucosidase-like glycosyl hydrolase/CubicO group peptidase (beta-lactamase class C family)
MKQKYIYISIFCLLSFFSTNRLRAENIPSPSFYEYENDIWVDSVFNSLTFKEKIAQLIMVAAYSNKTAEHEQDILRHIKNNKIGGIIFMQGGPHRQINLTNKFQKESKTPLIIAMDAEWGLGQRLDSCLKYPYAMTCGAINNDSLIFRMGADIAEQCKRLGVHINFAPVTDVNVNPLNPVIGFRSFGEDVDKVSDKAIMYAQGLQSQNVLAVAKHFPGHGDTESDSHYTLPVIKHNRARLDSIEMAPFRKLIKSGTGGIMIAHLNIPALDSTGVPATISKQIIKNTLATEMQYSGLIVSDAMNMSGITSKAKAGKAEALAIAAGMDLLEFVTDPQLAIKEISKAVKRGDITKEEIENKCRKLLMIKRWVGLNNKRIIDPDNLYYDLSKPEYWLTIRKITEESLTVLQNKQDFLPLKKLDTLRIASISVGRDYITPFQKTLGKYTKVDHFHIDKYASMESFQKTFSKLKNYNVVVASVNHFWMSAVKNFHLTNLQVNAISTISSMPNSIITVFGNPYVLNSFPGIENSRAIILGYQESVHSQELAAQLIFGAIAGNGKLPVTVNKFFEKDNGNNILSLQRFKYTIPEELGINSGVLKKKIDSLINIALEQKAFPGCQIFLAKNAKVFFHECYGSHTYYNNQPVAKDDIYDWASLTKITGPLPALMSLYDEEKFDLDQKFSVLWPQWEGTNKEDLIIREVLAHQAGLIAWIPFWQRTVNEKGKFKRGFFKKRPSKKYSLRLARKMYLNNSFIDTIYTVIAESELLPEKKYLYSGLSFYLYPEIIENISGEDYETYLTKNIYRPLGAWSVKFNAYKHYPLDQIVPTENDDFFRRELLHGFVHDEGCAMMGGVSGNAGLFGTINDAAKIMQMYMNYGEYGGERYIKESTLREWTSRQFEEDENRRGLGFDKPYIDNHENKLEDAYPAPSSSASSFGHSGYTGTFAWADPETGLLFILFSNRVYPTRDNPLIYDLNLRPQLHQAIYDVIDN